MEIIIVIYYIMEVKSFQIVPRINAFQTNIEDVCREGRFPKFTWRLDACIQVRQHACDSEPYIHIGKYVAKINTIRFFMYL